MTRGHGRPKLWRPGTERGDALWEAIQVNDTWEQVTESVNSTFGEDYTVHGVKSAAYRNNWNLETKLESKTRRDNLNETFGITSENDIPIYKIDASDDREWIPIWHCSDMHAGSDTFNVEPFMDFRERMLKLGAYVIGNGDWLEAAVPTGKMPQTIWGQSVSVREQKDWVRRCFLPFNVIKMEPGNHEYRLINLTSEDPLESVADECGAYYSRYPCPVIIQAGDHVYKLFSGHGKSVRKDMFSELYQWANIFPGCDTYALGHDHNLAARPLSEHFRFGGIETSVDGKEMLSVMPVTMEHVSPIGMRTGHWLKYGGYVRQAPYEPKRNGSPIVWINQREKRVVVDIFDTGSAFDRNW